MIGPHTHGDQVYSKYGYTDLRVMSVLDYARTHLRGDLQLSELARVANVSTWHICRLFRTELGTSPSRCVKLLRLRIAADLLATTFLTVKEVMASVGLNDESHFVRDFHTVFGQTPIHFRSSLGNTKKTDRFDLPSLANS